MKQQVLRKETGGWETHTLLLKVLLAAGLTAVIWKVLRAGVLGALLVIHLWVS